MDHKVRFSMVRTFTKFVEHGLRLIEKALVAVVMVMIVVMTAAIFYMVLSRFVEFPWRGGWATELSQYLMVYIAFLPASYILRRSGHVALDIVYDRASRVGKKSMMLASTVIGAITVTVFATFSTEVVWSAWQRDLLLRGAIDMPRYLAVLPIAIGLIMLAIRLWNSFLILLIELNGQPEDVEAS